MRTLFCCLLLSALVLGAAELTGAWSGSFEATNSEGDTHPNTVYMMLKESDGVVTGTAGPNADKQWSIRNGKLNGQKLTFEVAMDDGGTIVFDLAYDGDTIRGTCVGTGENGEKMTAKLNLKRTT